MSDGSRPSGTGPTVRRSRDGSSWLLRPHPEPQAGLRLFCLPHAGGDTWMFRDWHLALSPDVEVCPIRLPGRGSRIAEPPFTEFDDLVEALAGAMVDVVDRPFAIFGHSMGALIGFELARRLRRYGCRSPAMLCAAACRAPPLATFRPAISHLPPYLLLAAMQRQYGTGGDLAGNDDLMRLMLPIIRADFNLCEGYVYRDDAPLECPIAAYGGTEDNTVEVEALDTWEHQTSDAFQRHAVTGDHFFPIGSKTELLDVLTKDLAWAMS